MAVKREKEEGERKCVVGRESVLGEQERERFFTVTVTVSVLISEARFHFLTANLFISAGTSPAGASL